MFSKNYVLHSSPMNREKKINHVFDFLMCVIQSTEKWTVHFSFGGSILVNVQDIQSQMLLGTHFSQEIARIKYC